jgi:hypothetical protein
MCEGTYLADSILLSVEPKMDKENNYYDKVLSFMCAIRQYLQCMHFVLHIFLLPVSLFKSANIMHGRATEEGRRTGFPHLRYGCQLRASALEHSSIWPNLKCILHV